MFFPRRKRFLRTWRVCTDGAIRPEQGVSGLAAVVFDETGGVALWWYRAAGKMTCNEAEYAAVIFALDRLMPFRPLDLEICSDSQVLVRQMRGEASVRSPALRRMHSLLREQVSAFHQVSFVHIAREQNRLADALANEAVLREVGSALAGLRSPGQRTGAQEKGR